MREHVLFAHQVMRQVGAQLSCGHCATTGGVAIAPDIEEGDFAVFDLVVST